VTDTLKPDEGDLVLDWDDVESFKLDFEDSARAESAPFPQRTAPTSPAGTPMQRDSIPEQDRPTLPPFGFDSDDQEDTTDAALEALESPSPFDPPTATRVSPGPLDLISLADLSSTVPPDAPSTPPAVLTVPPWPTAPSVPPTLTATPWPPLTPSIPPPAAPSPSATPSWSSVPPVPAGTKPAGQSLVPGGSSSPFGRTLAGLPPVPQPPEGPLSGGVLQQRVTLRPEQIDTVPPAPPAPSEAEPTRPSQPEPSPRASTPGSAARASTPQSATRPSVPDPARPRMYQPPTPQELASFSHGDDDDDVDVDATQVAAVPRELLDALLAGKVSLNASSNRITERPPAAPVDAVALARKPAPKPSEPEISTDDSDDSEDTETELQLPDVETTETTERTSLRPLLGRLSQAPRISSPPATPPQKGLPPAAPAVVARLSLPAVPRVSMPAKPPASEEVLTDLDELLPPVASPPSEKPRPAERTVRADHGAKAAQHTVSARRPRSEDAPLASLDEGGKRARLPLLEALAAKQTGRAQAALLVSAAELNEELHELDAAKELYARAHAAWPKLLTSAWALVRLSFERRDFVEQLSWLTRISELADAPRTRASALAAKARILFLIQRELPEARAAALEATRLCPDDVAHRLLLSRIELAHSGREADESLVQLASALQDDTLFSALSRFAGRAREHKQESGSAIALYMAANARAGSVEGALLLARLSRASQQSGQAAEALRNALPALEGSLGEAVRRHAAVLLASDPARRPEALALLAESEDGASLRTAYGLSIQLADSGGEERAASAWAARAEGRERALALTTQAELWLKRPSDNDASLPLEEAVAVDRSLTLARVLWEGYARETGSVQSYLRRAQGATDGSMLRGVAKLAFDESASNTERELIERSSSERERAACLTLRDDLRSELGDLAGVASDLRLACESAPSATRMLLLADLLRRAHGEAEARDQLERATSLFPDDLLVTRAFARSSRSPEDIARALLLESGTARGPRAAFLHVLAGRVSSDPAARLAAFERAYEAHAQYPQGVFALHAEARRQNELERLAMLHSREAARAKDPFDAVSHLLRAALVRAPQDGDAAASQLTRALDMAPSDPVLRELVLRLGDAVPASLRAEAMQRTAERAAAPFDRAAALSAAGAFEDAGQAERALALYESVLSTHGEDPVAELGRERVARAAGKARELLEAKRRALHEASTDAGRVHALEELLQADQDAPAEESLDRARALLVLAPSHPLALRRLERHAMERNDQAGLFDAELRLFHASTGKRDKLSRLRLLSLLTAQKRGERIRADDLDRVVVEGAEAGLSGMWFTRQLMSAAVALADPKLMLTAVESYGAETHEPVELTSLAVRRARLMLSDPPDDRELRLSAAFASYPDHPTAKEALAEREEARGASSAAARSFEQAAEAALHKPRAARLFARAGQLYEALSDVEQAKAAYIKAVEADVTVEDVEARVQALFSKQNDIEGLIRLYEARLKTSTSPPEMAKLREQLAELHEQRGDDKLAIVVLREALEQEPEHLGTLRELSRLLGKQHEPRERAQVLLRIARLSREPMELRDVFMQLGDIYDKDLPDAKRAEAAYQRALKLGPRHTPALERLASLYKREGKHDHAEAALERLIQLAETPEKRLSTTFELSREKESRGDARGAEEVLEALRRDTPVDPEVLRALVAFYRRQGALSALAMHLNRATSDLRTVVEREPDRSEAWLSLIDVLDEKHRPDAARVAASAAIACGVESSRARGLVEADGSVPGVSGAAFSELLDDLVFGEQMPPSTRIVFRHGAEALNKAAPFDLRAVGGERLDRRHPLRAIVQEASRWAGLPEAEVFITAHLPLAFVPVSDAPAQLLVGQTLLDTLTRGEQLFLSARALKIARAQMSLTSRVRPDEMGLLLHGLIRSQMPGYEPAGVDLSVIDEMGRRVMKHMSRRSLTELLPHLMELMGAANFDPARVYTVASTAGNRAGLLATGSLGHALSALIKLAGLQYDRPLDRELLEKVEEARDLLSFALSEAHFEARLRAGVDLR
jgi:tetratricopeptide (TPR) repeat protein